MPKYTYGPVPSRRLGLSLGVDLVPLKTCTMSCIYCQLGPTPQTTITRAEYAPVEDVVEDVRRALERPHQPDYVTLGGSGEPTLHSGFGRIAELVRAFAPCPIALLTNGTLFYVPEVRAACSAIDVILPTLDAGDEETFQRIHRPHPSLSLEKVVGGLIALRRQFKGQLWVEVFLVPGFNTADEDIAKLQAQLRRIKPDKIQLNTAVRPPAEKYVHPLPPARLEEICIMLGPRAEVIAEPPTARHAPERQVEEEAILEMLARRPCTVEDIATGLGVHRHEVIKCVGRLLEAGRLRESREGDRVFYAAT
jgi:wyosine [tRNA(Phe)-imidazoG37] synthetase (radical SAM superfamily)